jgi:sulfatase maturation enzyme AslB (radical SAM superfamily)
MTKTLPTNGNPRVKPPTSKIDDQFGYLGDARNELYLHPSPSVLNIFPVEGDPEFLVREALKRDLSKVEKIRFDPVNVCNLACVFCTSDLKAKHAQISPNSLKLILRQVSKTCRRITVGCGYEPLMATNIDEYFQVIQEIVGSEFLERPTINLITNGLLLGNRNVSLFADNLSWIHISVHSHIKENFEKIEKRAKFESLVSNINKIRSDFPALNIHIEYVANRINMKDVENFIPWVFNELKADSLNIKRVATGSFHSKSYLADSILSQGGDNLGLTDEEWKSISEQVQKVWPSELKLYSAFCSPEQMLKKSAFTEVIEI